MKLITKNSKTKETTLQHPRQPEEKVGFYNNTNDLNTTESIQNPFEKENKIPLKRKPLEYSLFNNEMQAPQPVDKRREVKVIEAKGPSLEIFSERSLGK
jgi:hypothetical protein